MEKERIEFLSAVLIISKNPSELAKFYKDVIGIPLEEEQHGDTKEHFGCELGDLHFAIHPPDNFEDPRLGVGSIKLAFTVFDISELVRRLQEAKIKLAYPIKDVGFAKMTAIIDPDGNYIEFTELSENWFKHLEKRKKQGLDVVKRWQSLSSKTQIN